MSKKDGKTDNKSESACIYREKNNIGTDSASDRVLSTYSIIGVVEAFFGQPKSEVNLLISKVEEVAEDISDVIDKGKIVVDSIKGVVDFSKRNI